MESLFGSEMAGRRRLPPAMRRLIVDLKAEHPALKLSEISRICYARFGRRPDERTVRRVLEEEPLPLRMIRRYPPYREIPEARERRAAVVALHAEGWTVKAIASHLRINRDTAYVALKRWIEEGEAGLEDRPRGRPSGVRKVDMRAIAAVRKIQENLELGEFRVHTALAQIGIHLSPRTCGRILALNRALYGLEKPSGGDGRAKTMPFSSGRRHEFWTADVRYLGREAALWLHAGSLTLEHEGQALSRYDVERAAGTDRLASVARPRLFQTPYALVQPRLSRLDEAVWLKALKLDDYAARKPRCPSALQESCSRIWTRSDGDPPWRRR